MLGVIATGCDHARENQAAVPDVTGDQISVCHAAADSTFRLVADEPQAFATHLLHGDSVPTGPVPDQPGFVFTAACHPTEDTDDGPCPAGMASIEGFCMDRWESHLRDQDPYLVPTGGAARTAPGVVPQGYISGDVAAAACQAVGKRLCTSPEWLRACRGPLDFTFPYGDSYRAGACNEGREPHPILELFGDAADWSRAQMNDPRINQLPNSLAPTGSYPTCMSVDGIYDMHGNLHEWVADAEGTFRGGFYVDAEINGAGCGYQTTAHGRSYHDYSIGFRCCADTE